MHTAFISVYKDYEKQKAPASKLGEASKELLQQVGAAASRAAAAAFAPVTVCLTSFWRGSCRQAAAPAAPDRPQGLGASGQAPRKHGNQLCTRSSDHMHTCQAKLLTVH